MLSSSKNESRKRRHHALRKRVVGAAERPRLAVFRSARHIYAQVIDDLSNKVLVAACDLEKDTQGGGDKKRVRAKKVGAAVAKKCLEKGIGRVVFDRGGYKYHGRVSALADGAREAGLEF